MHEHEGQNKTSTRGAVIGGFESENKCHEGSVSLGTRTLSSESSVFLETRTLSRESSVFLEMKVHRKGIKCSNKYENIMKWKKIPSM